MLAVTQRPISKICISTKVADTMLPCHKSAATLTSERRLAAAETTNASDHCASQVFNYSINLNYHILENEEVFFFIGL